MHEWKSWVSSRTGMSLLIVFLLEAAALFTGPADARSRVAVDPDAAPDPASALVSVSLAPAAGDAVGLIFEIAGFDLQPVDIDGRLWQRVDLDREARRLDPGAPELPHLCRSIVIPDRAQMAVRVTESRYRDYPDVDIAPSKGNLDRGQDPSAVPFVFGETYARDAWYPADLVTPREPYVLRGCRGLVVDVNAFQYNPVRRVLRVYDRVVVEAVPEGAGQVNVLERPAAHAKQPSAFVDLYQEHFVNYRPPDPSDEEPGEMLVIAHDAFVPAVREFVAWKNQRGLPTRLVPTSKIGVTVADFAGYIANYYATHNLAFVLLVGDVAQIPSPISFAALADPVYALLSGEDSYPDIFLGRLSAETFAEAQLQARKFIEYERDLGEGASWCHKGTGIASAQGEGIGDDGEADYQHMNNIRTDLLSFTYTQVDTFYPIDGYPYSAQSVADAVNAGRGLVNYCGHGSSSGWTTTGFNSGHVDALVNMGRLPWIISVACYNGTFGGLTCFAEAWLRANAGGEPTGAVGMYASSIRMTWAPPMAAQDEIIDLLVARREATYGALCFLGACRMIDEYPANSDGPNEYRHWHVFGDPSLVVRTDTPVPLVVRHEERVAPRASTVAIDVAGVAGAQAAVSREGRLLGLASTDASGHADIFVAGGLPPSGEVTLTVTAFNRATYVARLPVGEKYTPVIAGDPRGLKLGAFCEGTQAIPRELALEPARPNPSPAGARVRLALPEPGVVELAVYDMAGRRVRVLAAENLPAGAHDFAWDGRDESGREAPGGVYFYRLRANERVLGQRLLLIR